MPDSNGGAIVNTACPERRFLPSINGWIPARAWQTCLGLLALMVGCLGAVTTTTAQIVDTGFNPAPNGVTWALAEQADGKLLVAGTFTTIAGQSSNRIARLHVNGSVDTSFDAGAGAAGSGAQIRALAVQPDGRIVVGGFFTSFAGQATLHRLVRLLPDGSVDPDFVPGQHRLQTVRAIVVLPDGRLLVAGGSNTQGQLGVGLARLHADGSIDTSFDPGIIVTAGTVAVETLVVQNDGRILIGGNFHGVGGQPRNHLARLHPDGSLDTSFNPQPNGNVHALAVQGDESIVIGGAFTAIGIQPRGRLARLHPDGSLDSAFDPGANDRVHNLVLQPDGRILAGGAFTMIDGQPRNRVARLQLDGTLADAFVVPFLAEGSSVQALRLQSDGRVLASSFNPLTIHNRLLRFNADGTLDNTLFRAAGNGAVLTTVVQADGKLVVGGEFTQISGEPRGAIARLRGDGRLDADFAPNANGHVQALAIDALGRILVGGDFTRIGAVDRRYLARLLPDGALDMSFDPAPNSVVRALAVQADGRILIGGAFNTLSGQAHERLARLNDDGTVDSSFPAQANNIVTGFAIQPDGRILVVGWFSSIAGQPRSLIARLLPDGSLDEGFSADPDSQVNAVAVQVDGRIVIGGDFQSVAGEARQRLARLLPDGSLDASFAPTANGPPMSIALRADGQIVVVGAFTEINETPRTRLVRLSADGDVDPALNLPIDQPIITVALQTDGRIVVGGYFVVVDGYLLDGLARLAGPEAAWQSLTMDGASVRWRRGGSGPELTATPVLQRSVDGVSFQTVTDFARSDDGWRATAVAPPPAGQMHWLRAHGTTAAGLFNGSGGAAASTLLVHGNDRLFADGFE